MEYLVSSVSRFLVHADSPQQALDWLNGDSNQTAFSLGHEARVFPIDDCYVCRALLPAELDVDSFYRAHGCQFPLVSRWAPAAWPSRTACIRLLQTTDEGVRNAH